MQMSKASFVLFKFGESPPETKDQVINDRNSPHTESLDRSLLWRTYTVAKILNRRTHIISLIQPWIRRWSFPSFVGAFPVIAERKQLIFHDKNVFRTSHLRLNMFYNIFQRQRFFFSNFPSITNQSEAKTFLWFMTNVLVMIKWAN